MSNGYTDVMSIIREDDIKHDPFGTSMSWLFCIAEVMHVDADEIMPDYRPSPVVAMPTRADVIEDNSYASDVFAMLDAGTLTHDDLRRVYAVLGRYTDWLRFAKRDY